MTFLIMENFKNTAFIIDFALCLVLLLGLNFLTFRFLKRKFVICFFSFFSFAFLLSMIFNLNNLQMILSILLIVGYIIFFFINISEIRKFIINPTKSAKKTSVPNSIEMNKENLFKIIDETVHSLSKQKIGAILTFEKTASLSEIIKSGTIINCPITTEILQTIFYPGTRLHDGAVVIRDNTIIAASVFFTPTTRALTGKYGSRHRAAFGISEITDSVTIVVSEETGRISIAYMGRLEPVSLDRFLIDFKDYMNR